MEQNQSNSRLAGLPYLNNFWIAFGTALLNVACVLAFHWGETITARSVVVSAIFCGVCTSLINITVIWIILRRMRRAGTLPPSAPQSRLMMFLPKNPVLLCLIFAVFFGTLTPLLNDLVIRFYGITSFALARFAVWQAAYSCVLSSVIADLAVLRFVQPDCAVPGQKEQTGTAKVRNPLSKISSLTGWFNTVTADFGFNMVIGLLLGGTVVTADQNVVIRPTTRAGIVISALILGIIVTLRMAYPIMKTMRDARETGALPPFETKSRWLCHLPLKPWGMTLTLLLPIMLLSALVCWAVFTFFDFEALNFFQFFVIRTVYVAVLSKGVVALALGRYRQPNE